MKDDQIVQCCTCEQVFTVGELTSKRQCPFCLSGNWVFGYIDDNDEEGA